jgi:hypothetical protein
MVILYHVSKLYRQQTEVVRNLEMQIARKVARIGAQQR